MEKASDNLSNLESVVDTLIAECNAISSTLYTQVIKNGEQLKYELANRDNSGDISSGKTKTEDGGSDREAYTSNDIMQEYNMIFDLMLTAPIKRQCGKIKGIRRTLQEVKCQLKRLSEKAQTAGE